MKKYDVYRQFFFPTLFGKHVFHYYLGSVWAESQSAADLCAIKAYPAVKRLAVITKVSANELYI